MFTGAVVDWMIAPYPSGAAWLGVGFLTIFCSILGYHCWNLAIAEAHFADTRTP